MLQEEIRAWVANVIMDALKQGFSQNLLFEPEDLQSGLVPSPGTPSTHLERFLYAMLLQADTPPRATRTYVYRDSNEQIFNILLVRPACASPQSSVEEYASLSSKAVDVRLRAAFQLHVEASLTHDY